ncbi:hypothetical protein PR048_022123 [Dryococelus australis]|uniref:Tyrosine-protein kinase catalytic domain-containing protein n=1 Tax=Dryococelus australis TaxID=614101 RepID=A0ABQ9H057_9NEOP|nr:hypothetical protein PR048_022123 [Dryococelus australis]
MSKRSVELRTRLVFFCREADRLFYCEDCRFVSGSYLYTRVSSPEMFRHCGYPAWTRFEINMQDTFQKWQEHWQRYIATSPLVAEWNIVPSEDHAHKCREADLVIVPRHCLHVTEKVGSCHVGEVAYRYKKFICSIAISVQFFSQTSMRRLDFNILSAVRQLAAVLCWLQVLLCDALGLEGVVGECGRMAAARVHRKSSDEAVVAREVRFLAALKDPNVARVLGLCTDEQPAWTVVEYCDMGDLAHFLHYTVHKETTILPPSSSTSTHPPRPDTSTSTRHIHLDPDASTSTSTHPPRPQHIHLDPDTSTSTSTHPPRPRQIHLDLDTSTSTPTNTPRPPHIHFDLDTPDSAPMYNLEPDLPTSTPTNTPRPPHIHFNLDVPDSAPICDLDPDLPTSTADMPTLTSMYRLDLNRLACSPPTNAYRVQSRPGHSRIFTCGIRAGRCHWLAGLLPFPPPFHYGAAPHSSHSPSSALKTSLNCLVGRGYKVKVADIAMCSSLYQKDYTEVGERMQVPIRWLPWESIVLMSIEQRQNVRAGETGYLREYNNYLRSKATDSRLGAGAGRPPRCEEMRPCKCKTYRFSASSDDGRCRLVPSAVITKLAALHKLHCALSATQAVEGVRPPSTWERARIPPTAVTSR